MNDKTNAEESGASASQLAADSQQVEESRANMEVILQELRDFRQENGGALREIKEEINKTNNRIEEAEQRIAGAEERIQCMEDAVLELLKLQTHLEARLRDQEGRSRRDNIRIHGVCEGAENNSSSVISFVCTLLKDNLDLPSTMNLEVERAHRALGP